MGRKSRAAVRGEREQVLLVVREGAMPLSAAQIRTRYSAQSGLEISYAALRRRLRELVEAGLIQPSDTRRRDPRFQPTRNTTTVGPGPAGLPPSDVEATAVSNSPAAIPLSAEARASRAVLLRPATQRIRTTYDPDFLSRYIPGETWYLPSALREHLRTLGVTAFAEQPAGTYAREIMGRLIIDLSWGSSRLEGNRYSRIDTEELLNNGRAAEGASATDRQMILNHKAAIEFLVENADDIAFDRRTVLGLHALLSENLMTDPDDEGRLRTRPVAVGSMYLPTAVPQLIEREFDQVLAKASSIPDPIEQAFFIMVHLPYLQPFMDVNKRTSRLAANIPLITANLCPLSFIDVPEQTYTEGTLAVYEQTDVVLLLDVFAWAYERSCQAFTVIREAMGAPDPIRLAYRLLLRAFVGEMVREQKWPTPADAADWADRHQVPEMDRNAFVLAARQALAGLRAEILARYSLRPSEFNTWSAAVAGLRTKVTPDEVEVRRDSPHS